MTETSIKKQNTRGNKRKLYNSLPYNIETWEPHKLTHINMLLMIVLLTNIFTSASLSVSYFIAMNNIRFENIDYVLMTLTILNAASFSLILLRYKWAVWLSFAISAAFASIAFAHNNYFQGIWVILTTAIFALIVKAHWWPVRIPTHILEKHGLATYGAPDQSSG